MAKLTTQQVASYIKAYLGAPGLHVELADSQYQVAIDDALTVYSRYAPLNWPVPLQAVSGVSKYELPAISGTPSIMGIFDVQPQRPGIGAPLNDIDIFRTPVMVDFTRGFNVVDYSLITRHYENFVQEFATEFDWEEYNDPADDKWYVLISPPPASGFKMVAWVSVVWKVDNVPFKDHDWIKKYSLECAREMLGAMRSKFTSLPSALGSVEMNGAQLLEAATTKKTELEAEIQGRNPVTPLIIQG